MGVTLGERPPGLAHRVLGDVREAPRDQLRDPRRRHGPRVPTPRERDRAVTRARPRLRADLDAQRHAEHGRGGDAQVRRQRRAPDGGARPVRAGDRAALLHDRSVAEASRLLGSDPDRGEGAGRDAPQRAAGGDALERRLGRVRRSAGGRLQHAGGARDPARMGADRGPRGASSRARRVRAGQPRRAGAGAARGRRRSPRLASKRVPRATSPRPTGSATRSRRTAGRCATWPRATSSCRARDPRPRLRAERRARGAPRTARGARVRGRASVRCPPSTGLPRARVLASTRSASSPRRRGRPITRASSPGARRSRTPMPGSSRPSSGR